MSAACSPAKLSIPRRGIDSEKFKAKGNGVIRSLFSAHGRQREVLPPILAFGRQPEHFMRRRRTSRRSRFTFPRGECFASGAGEFCDGPSGTPRPKGRESFIGGGEVSHCYRNSCVRSADAGLYERYRAEYLPASYKNPTVRRFPNGRVACFIRLAVPITCAGRSSSRIRRSPGGRSRDRWSLPVPHSSTMRLLRYRAT